MIHQTRDKIVGFSIALRDSLNELLKNDPLRMAGATAFFTTFALPPILVILIQSLKLIISPHTIRKELFTTLSGIFGPETVLQITGVLQALRKLAQNWWITVVGFIFLLFVATTLFKIIKNSLNQLWKIRPVQKLGIMKNLRARVQAILVILIAGVLFAIGIMATTVQIFIGHKIFAFSPVLSIYFSMLLSYIISIVIIMLWFAAMFRYLPDGRPEWPIAFVGALLTSILFTIGKIILHWLLSYSNINTVYGTSAAIVLLLLFMFYTALILYYGAAFTKIWGIKQGKPIRPLPHAIHYKVIEAEIELNTDTGSGEKQKE